MRVAKLRACILLAVAVVFPSICDADIVTDWNQKAGASVLEAKIFPFAGTRVMAIMHTAMFDAINSIEGHYTPYKFKCRLLPAVRRKLLEWRQHTRPWWCSSPSRRPPWTRRLKR